MTTEHTSTLRGALSNALCNASNFPRRVQPYLLGQDMGPLLDATTDAILHWLAEHDRETRAEALEEAAQSFEGPDRFIRDTDVRRRLRDMVGKVRA
jgi:hypothetical protein